MVKSAGEQGWASVKTWMVGSGVFVAIVVCAGFLVLFASLYVDALGLIAGKDGGGSPVRWVGLPLVLVSAALSSFLVMRARVRRGRRQHRGALVLPSSR